MTGNSYCPDSDHRSMCCAADELDPLEFIMGYFTRVVSNFASLGEGE